jgi:hypothetical protein
MQLGLPDQPKKDTGDYNIGKSGSGHSKSLATFLNEIIEA